jgi:hypothetical protein
MFFSVFSSFCSASSISGNLYKDPRDRYTVNLPQSWTILEDGRRDVFKGIKGKEEAFFTVMSFPPSEEKITMEKFMNKAIALLQPDEVLDNKEIELYGLNCVMIDLIKEDKIGIYNIDDKLIEKVKSKLSEEKVKKLEDLKDRKFTQDEFTETLTGLKFSVDDVLVVGKYAFKIENTGIIKRKIYYFLFRKDELLTLVMEADEKYYEDFLEDFSSIKDSFNVTKTFGGCLYIDPKGIYSLQLPYNWGTGNENKDETVYFTGLYDNGKAIATCDIEKMAKPLATSDINQILDYWVKEIKNKVKKTETGFKIAGLDAAFVQYEYIQEDGRAHTVNNYIFTKGSYLFVIRFECAEDYLQNFEPDYDFILNSLQIEI